MQQGFGLIHLYWGEGKGKTSAALGLALRAAGRGKQVRMARFLKTEDSGELIVLRRISNIQVLPCEKCFGFTFQMGEAKQKEAAAYYRGLFERAIKEAARVDLLILDEILAACNGGLVEKGKVEEFLEGKPKGLEVVLTGREPWERIMELADYVTEMRKWRHPFDREVTAREGIEF